MKVALVHYWLVSWRGGEKVLEALCRRFPDADIFTHVLDPEVIKGTSLENRRIHTTFINRLPFAKRLYQNYLPLMPLALEDLDLRGYDLVISSESGPAKGVIVQPDAVHICYCHSPMRYLWDMYHDYTDTSWAPKRWIMSYLIHRLRAWDRLAAMGVDVFVSNSEWVAKRIEKYYRREATVVHPPVDIASFSQSNETGDFYLMVGQLTRYKRTDIGISAFNKLGKNLVIIGEGEEMAHLRKTAGSNITFLGKQPFKVLQEHYAKCRALIFPGVEDFGIVPIEAMASGRPVIAYRKGGAMESIVDGETGVFFEEQTSGSLIAAVERFESRIDHFNSDAICAHAKKFSTEAFLSNFEAILASTMRRKFAELDVCGVPAANPVDGLANDCNSTDSENRP